MRLVKIAWVFVVLCFAFESVRAQGIMLSEEAEVSVLTMGPGQEQLYSAFGHSALRIHDDQNSIDIFYNYGVFDFDQPNFYLNFAKGKLLYKLGLNNYSRQIKYYMRINRTIVEQTLDLTQSEKQEVFDVLMENAKPENAEYYYNYCYDNCATKIRDVINTVLAGKVQYNYHYASDSMSYRDLMDKYLGQQPWGDVGIDYCLGSEIDRLADGPAYMYMPEYLKIALDGAHITNDSTIKPLVKQKRTLNIAADKPSAASPITPFHVFVVLFFVVGIFTHRGLKYSLNFRFIDVILYGTTGLLGFSLLFLWFGTDHLSQNNLNLIWSTPLNLIALALLFKKERPAWLRYYFNAYGIVLILLIITDGALPQQLNEAFIPLVLALIVRSFYLGYWLKRGVVY
ncbi:DUF4105 domain-containing protein [Reichenbachiella agarivorans]|uniref:DUF4105 domain-containing protein n=1 Tax=Reichenbachiella agarivorans TaxID=2979464 RepID=A0ABY6CU31_9BACT|nr:DUF4105 domain-containing protein [Reichenbachiella agarivorans]UXP34026.1 DUF4105 domain-containing protein [Reichenbachiella agarivorans]